MNPEIIDHCTLKALEKPCEAVPGSVKNAWVLRLEDALQLPDCCPTNHLITDKNPIQVASGKNFVHYYFLPDQLIFTENGRKTKHGVLYDQKLEGINPGHSPEQAHEICKLTDGHYIVLVELYSGARRLIGSLDNPMQFLGSTSTARSRKERTSATFIFTRVGRCPACYLDESIKLPTELPTPWAYLRMISETPCDPVYFFSDHRLSDGSKITSSTPSSKAVIRYSFGPASNPWYIAEIAPDGDSDDISDWTYISGSRTVTQFEEEVVDYIGAPAKGNLFYLTPHVLSWRTGSREIDVRAVVVESGLTSNVSSDRISIPTNVVFRVIKRAAANGTMVIDVNYTCNVLVLWGDDDADIFELTPGSLNTLTHNYAASGDYEIEFHSANPDNIKKLYLDDGISGLSIIQKMPNLREIDVSDADMGETINLSKLPAISTILLNNSGITETLLPQAFNATLSPIPLILEYVSPASEATNYIDFNLTTGSTFYIDWGDGTNETITGATGFWNKQHTFATSGVDHRVRIYGYSGNINWLTLSGPSDPIEDLYIGHALSSVTILTVTSAPDLNSRFSLQLFPNLLRAYLQNNAIQKFDIGNSTVLEQINLSGNDLDAAAMDDIINQCWNRRASLPSNVLNLTSNPGTPGATALDQINGTGAYVGEGLDPDYGWTITY